MFKVKLPTSPLVTKYLKYPGTTSDRTFTSKAQAEQTCTHLGKDLDYVEVVEVKPEVEESSK